LNRCSALIDRMATPADRAASRTTVAGVPSRSGTPARSLRISTSVMPSSRASAKKAAMSRRGAAMWLSAKVSGRMLLMRRFPIVI